MKNLNLLTGLILTTLTATSSFAHPSTASRIQCTTDGMLDGITQITITDSMIYMNGVGIRSTDTSVLPMKNGDQVFLSQHGAEGREDTVLGTTRNYLVKKQDGTFQIKQTYECNPAYQEEKCWESEELETRSVSAFCKEE